MNIFLFNKINELLIDWKFDAKLEINYFRHPNERCDTPINTNFHENLSTHPSFSERVKTKHEK